MLGAARGAENNRPSALIPSASVRTVDTHRSVVHLQEGLELRRGADRTHDHAGSVGAEQHHARRRRQLAQQRAQAVALQPAPSWRLEEK